jgi:Na+-driven multidrug efflux pump
MYAIKFGLILEIIIASVTFILAPYISAIFTTAKGSNVIAGDLTVFLMIIVLFYPGAAFGIASSSMFQGTGKGLYALIATLLRTIIFTLVLAYIAAFVLQTDLGGIWWAIVIANLSGSLVSFVWAKLYINNLLKGKKASSSTV